MGFDRNNSGPIIQPAKRTTKVNIAMALAVLAFFGFGVAAIAWKFFHH
jgi:hypothetical protein